MTLRQLLRSLPYPVKQSFRYAYGVLPPGVRHGRVFRDTCDFLRESQCWSTEQLKDYQMQQLKKLLMHAYENVPYYRRVFDERGFKPRHVSDFDDLRKLPYLTKDVIRENATELIANNIPKRSLGRLTTSGSTAAPLSFYYEKGQTQPLEDAFIETLWNRAGYQSKSRRVNLTWELVNKKDAWWEYNPADRTLILSPYHMNEQTMPRYVERIEKFRPRAIKAIPSTILVLANFMQSHNIGSFASVKVILLGSEMLYPWQRNTLEQVFNSRVFSWYGQAEKVVLAGECEESSMYHIFPEYGATELIGQNGEQITEENKRGEIVGTGFNNYAMPFIRYRTGDIAMLSNRKCQCGRNYPLLESIEGREHEFIVLKSGDLVPLLALPFSSFLSNVRQFQFYQDTPGEVTLRIVRMPHYARADSESILKGLAGGLNSNIRIRLEFVGHIPRTQRGKFAYMIQKIPIGFGVSSD